MKVNVERLRRRPPAGQPAAAAPVRAPRRVTAPAPIAGVAAYVERAYAAWCAKTGRQAKALERQPTAGTHPVGGANDPRRSDFNRDYVLAGDQWGHAPLPGAPQDTEPKDAPKLELSDHERAHLSSDEAKAVADQARLMQDVRDDEALCAEVDALLAERNGGVIANAELPWLADPTSAAERAAVNAKWDEIDALAARRNQLPMGNTKTGQVAA